MHNMCTQYSVQTSRMLSSTIYNSEKCFCSQSGEHGWVKQLYVKKVLSFSKWFAFTQIHSLFHNWQGQISICVWQERSTKKQIRISWVSYECVDEFVSAYPETCPEYKDFGVFVNWFPSFHMARISLKEDLASTKPS